jgi:hypothetical protein
MRHAWSVVKADKQVTVAVFVIELVGIHEPW